LGKAAALLDGEWKLIEREKGKTELFHITADPLEQQDLADAEPQRLAALRARLAELRQRRRDRAPARSAQPRPVTGFAQ
jgi:arylsulfatase A-like enzyme